MFCAAVDAQKIKLREGNKKVPENETTVDIEFKCDDLSICQFKKEEDYIAIIREEYSKKEESKIDKSQKTGRITGRAHTSRSSLNRFAKKLK